jgi:hypothetical protein
MELQVVSDDTGAIRKVQWLPSANCLPRLDAMKADVDGTLPRVADVCVS